MAKGTLYDKVQALSPSHVSTGGLYERAKLLSQGVNIEKTPAALVKPKGLVRQTVGNIRDVFRGEVSLDEVAKEVPEITKKLAGGFVDTFVPAISNFFKRTSKSI